MILRPLARLVTDDQTFAGRRPALHGVRVRRGIASQTVRSKLPSAIKNSASTDCSAVGASTVETIL